MFKSPDILALIKPPSIRVKCVADVAPEVLDALQADLENVVDVLPFKHLVTDIEIPGSWARGVWDFHSDLDVCFATGTPERHQQALRLWRGEIDTLSPKAKQLYELAKSLDVRIAVYRDKDMPESSNAARKLRELSHKWGVRIEMNMAYPTYKTQPRFTVYSLRERKHYRPEMNKVLTRYFFNDIDENGNLVANRDPYPTEEIEKWAKRYGDKALRLGSTEDSKWINERVSTDIPTS